MTESIPNPEFEEKITAACDAPKPNPLFVSHLRARLVDQAAAQVRKPLWERLGLALRRPALAVTLTALILVMLTTLVVGPQKVAAAVKEIIGYIPGFGFVQDIDTTLVLEAPAAVEREGITVTVQEVVAGPKQTDVTFQVSGIPQDKSKVQEPSYDPDRQPYLLLASGEKLPTSGGFSSTGAETNGQYAFGPLPSETTSLTLVLPRLPVPFSGAVYENWEIPLTLKPAQHAENVSDSVEMGWSSEQIEGVTLRLDNVLADPSQTVLQVSLVPADAGWQVIDWGKLRLEDETGKSYDLSEEPSGLLTFASRIFRTGPIDPSRQLTLTLDGAEIRDMVPDPSAQFTFNPGKDAAAGQTWDLDETVVTAGITVHVSKARLIAGQNGQIELEFLMDPVDGLSSVALFSKDSGGARWEAPQPGQPYVSSLSLEGIPDRPLTVQVSPIFHLNGPWQVSWK